MDELLKKLLAALPFFGTQLSGILTGPKTAILQQDLESDAALQRALTFLAVAFGLTYIAFIPIIAGSRNRLTFGVTAIQAAIAFAANVALVILVWKAVGAKLPLRKMLVVTCYFCGISTLLSLALTLIAAGAYALLDPVDFQHMLHNTAADPADLTESWGLRVFFLLSALSFVAVYAWIIYIWEIYRQLTSLSKTRSAIALILFTLLSPALFTIQILLSYELTPGNALFVPHDLVGTWESSPPPGSPSTQTLLSLTYHFAPPRHRISPMSDYSIVTLTRKPITSCNVTLEDRQSGAAMFQGSTITFFPYRHTQITHNGCTGTDSNSFIFSTSAQVRYQLDQQPTGWTLCLSDRFGESCLKPKQD